MLKYYLSCALTLFGPNHKVIYTLQPSFEGLRTEDQEPPLPSASEVEECDRRLAPGPDGFALLLEEQREKRERLQLN